MYVLTQLDRKFYAPFEDDENEDKLNGIVAMELSSISE